MRRDEERRKGKTYIERVEIKAAEVVLESIEAIWAKLDVERVFEIALEIKRERDAEKR